MAVEYTEECVIAVPVTGLDLLAANIETAAAMEITRQSYYRKGWENAMAIRGICEPLSSEAVEPYGRREEAHAQRILSL